MLAAKGGAIIASGNQPPLLFEAAPLFFGMALAGLFLELSHPRTALSKVGVSLALLATIAALAGILASLVSGTLFVQGSSSRDEFEFPSSVFAIIAGFGPVLALILLGAVARRGSNSLGSWRTLPLFLGIAYIPALVLGGALESLNPRLFELPIVLLGLGWALLGYALWVRKLRPPVRGLPAG